MIRYSENRELQAGAVAQLYVNAGVDRPITDLARIQQMINNSNLIITAWDGSALVGMARAMTDFGYCCYLADLAVDMNHQRKGIGRTLITLMQKAIGLDVSLVLMSSPGTTAFYETLGFNRFSDGFISKGIL